MIKVILVEDERFLRKGLLLTTPWSELGCQVVGEASGAVEGIGLAKRTHPDIVLTDIRMPQMSGLEMIGEIKKEVDAEFIIISGYDEFDYARTALGLGVRGYLLKPIDTGELVEMLRGAVEAVRKKRRDALAAESHAYLENRLPPLRLFADGSASFNERHVDKALAYMRAHCGRELTVKDVARELGISDSHLGKLVKAKTDFTFLELLTQIRMSRAIDLMEREEPMRIYEIAVAVGYRDARHFSEVFKKVVGVSPSEYRKGDAAGPENG